jgi:DNA-binding FadR family transcriptional regulator
MTAAVRLPQRGSLVEHAVRSIRDYIRTSGLKVGDTLPGEAQFASQLGVSRAVMREAFGALAALRLIDVGNGRRARVGAIDGSVMAASLDHAVVTAQVTVAQIWDVRRTLELRTAELAAEHRSDEEARLIVALADAMAAGADDLNVLTQHDIAFHQAIACASGNNLFHQIVRSFEGLMRSAVPAAWHTRVTEAQRATVLDRHRALAATIADRDPAAAAHEMGMHFDTSIGDLFVGT